MGREAKRASSFLSLLILRSGLFLLCLLAGEMEKSKEPLVTKIYFLFQSPLLSVCCSVACFLILLLVNNCEPNLSVTAALPWVGLIRNSEAGAARFLQKRVQLLRSVF